MEEKNKVETILTNLTEADSKNNEGSVSSKIIQQLIAEITDERYKIEGEIC